MKQVYVSHFNKNVKFGRKRPDKKPLIRKLSTYVKHNLLPTPPTSCDYSSLAADALSNDFLNNQLGDCVIAGGYHVVAVETANAGRIFTATNDQIIKDYSAIGGYIPGNPSTDGGCNIQTALNYWQTKGFANGTKILGWIPVDATDAEDIKLALYLFENIIFGVDLPDQWINPFPSSNGYIWDIVGPSNPNNGHCYIGSGFNYKGVFVNNWGLTGNFTWNAISEYAGPKYNGEAYVILTPDQVAKTETKAPNGILWNELIQDFDNMGGHVPVPVAPGTIPTLNQVQAWATSGFTKLIYSKSQAIKCVQDALKLHWPK